LSILLNVMRFVFSEDAVSFLHDTDDMIISGGFSFLLHNLFTLALQLRFFLGSESMGNHDSKIVDAGSVD
jgi:hypothetical protein